MIQIQAYVNCRISTISMENSTDHSKEGFKLSSSDRTGNRSSRSETG